MLSNFYHLGSISCMETSLSPNIVLTNTQFIANFKRAFDHNSREMNIARPTGLGFPVKCLTVRTSVYVKCPGFARRGLGAERPWNWLVETYTWLLKKRVQESQFKTVRYQSRFNRQVQNFRHSWKQNWQAFFQDMGWNWIYITWLYLRRTNKTG